MGEAITSSSTRLILPALCWNRQRSDFYAVTADVSVLGLRFRSSVVPDPGETLSCSIRHAGSLEAQVIECGKEHFVTRVLRAEAPLPVIVRRLLELAADQNGDDVPQRAHPRFVPDHPDILVTMACGTQIPGRLINVSASGAAVRIDVPLEPGTADHARPDACDGRPLLRGGHRCGVPAAAAGSGTRPPYPAVSEDGPGWDCRRPLC